MVRARKCDVLYLQYPNVDYYPPTINGLRAMAGRGLTVEVLCCADWPSTGVAYPEGVNITRLDGKPAGGWKSPAFLCRFIRRGLQLACSHRPLVIYGSNMQGIVSAGIIGHALGIPYIHHCYDLYLPEEGMGLFDKQLKPLERLFSKRAKCLIFPSESKARLFLRTSRMDREYTVVANAPLRQPERRTDALRRIIRARGGQADYVVLYQGSIGPTCGVDALIRSIPDWPDGTVLALLGIVRPSGLINRLHELAGAVGVEDRFFHLGVVNYDQLFRLTCSADLGVFLPTQAQSNYVHSGTAVNKIMEYMACGVPSLVAAYPALKALAEETGAGVAVDPSDPEAVAQRVSEMLVDRDMWRTYAQNARKAHLEQYHFERQFAPVLNTICRFKGASATACPAKRDANKEAADYAGAVLSDSSGV